MNTLRKALIGAGALLALSHVALAEDEHLDIVDTAVAAGSFTTLAAALEAAGLIETLKGEDVVKLDSAPTVHGQSIEITVEGSTVKVDAATVVAVDVLASNGVIHVIDSVILPE